MPVSMFKFARRRYWRNRLHMDGGWLAMSLCPCSRTRCSSHPQACQACRDATSAYWWCAHLRSLNSAAGIPPQPTVCVLRSAPDLYSHRHSSLEAWTSTETRVVLDFEPNSCGTGNSRARRDNGLKNLEVLQSIEKEQQERRGPLTRRQGMFEKDGTVVDLPKLVSCSRSQTIRSNLNPLTTFMNRSS